MRKVVRFIMAIEWLAYSLWIGGGAVVGLVVAPIVFVKMRSFDFTGSKLGQNDIAGRIFGTILHTYYYLSYACAGLILLCGLAIWIFHYRPGSTGKGLEMTKPGRLFWAKYMLVFVLLLVALYSGEVVSGRLDELQRGLTQPIDLLPQDSGVRAEFDHLHNLSVWLLEGILAGGLLLLGLFVSVDI